MLVCICEWTNDMKIGLDCSVFNGNLFAEVEMQAFINIETIFEEL